MDEKTTKDLHNKKSFEERVFARFDAFDARFDSIEVRLENLEARNYDTKPIWEKALVAIMETQLEVGEIKTKVNAIETKVDRLETKVDRLETKVDAIEVRLDTVEGTLAGMRSDYANLHNQLVDTQRDFTVRMTRRVDLVLEVLVDTRADMRKSDERLTQLESKLA